MKRTCNLPGCDKPHRARGLCATHYNHEHQPNRHAARTVSCAACGASIEREPRGARGGTRRPACSDACRSFLRTGAWPPPKPGTDIVGPIDAPRARPTWSGHVIPASRRVFIQGGCEWCGERFTAIGMMGGSLPRTCSKRCARGVQKSRRQFQVSPVRRRRLYERDNWTCQICMEPIDREADRNDDWAPSLDHIVCQSWGEPDHSDANLRTAHRWCNAVRGDETYYSDADLAA